MVLTITRSERASHWRALRAATSAMIAVSTFLTISTAGSFSPAVAQVKVPAKAKVKVPVKAALRADPADTSADQLNAKWLSQSRAVASSKNVDAGLASAVHHKLTVSSDWSESLVLGAMNYLGTPYRYGGISPNSGFDCSGFVYYLYGAVFQLRIPRMPHDMARAGTSVARNELKRGDLVFFDTRGSFSHMGIYVGDEEFIHAPHTGARVQIASMDSGYYRGLFAGAVRLPPP